MAGKIAAREAGFFVESASKDREGFMEQLVNKPGFGAVVFAAIFIVSLLMLLADKAVAR